LLAGPGTVSYSAAKHAVVGLSKGLRLEAERHNVKVSVLCPGAVRTPILTGGIYGRMDKTGATEEDILKSWEPTRPMAPEKFADRALRAVLRGDAIVIVPAWWKALWYLDRLSTTMSMQVGRLVLKRIRELQSVPS
jgi:short-subunit dehydrogenase